MRCKNCGELIFKRRSDNQWYHAVSKLVCCGGKLIPDVAHPTPAEPSNFIYKSIQDKSYSEVLECLGNDVYLPLARFYALLNNELCDYYSYEVAMTALKFEGLYEFVDKIVKEFKLPLGSVYIRESERVERRKVYQVNENDLLREVNNLNVTIIFQRDLMCRVYRDNVEICYNKKSPDCLVLFTKLKELCAEYYQPSHVEPMVGLVGVSCNGNMELNYFTAKQVTVDIDKHYNDDFKLAHETIYEFCKKEQTSGLVMLHGRPGTGKTTYMRYLFNLLGSFSRIIYLPNDLIHLVSSPRFIPFMRDNAESIIILEDCEKVLQKRTLSDTDSRGVSNILNLTDGILSDCLGLKIIATFNCDVGQIDEALLRKGRLICDYEFKPLVVEKARRLFEELGKMEEFEKEYHEDGFTLADIFNSGIRNKFSTPMFGREVGFSLTSSPTHGDLQEERFDPEPDRLRPLR